MAGNVGEESRGSEKQRRQGSTVWVREAMVRSQSVYRGGIEESRMR